MNDQLNITLKHLKLGNTIVYPTDTVWGIGCDATNYEAIQNIFTLKKREESKTMIVLVDSIVMLKKHVNRVPDMAYEMIKSSTKPLTIIYDKPQGIAENLIAADDTLAIRVVNDPFCEALIKELKKPLVSTSANISGEATPKTYSEISEEILLGVDYVVNLHQDRKSPKPSSIIKLSNSGLVKVIRE